MTGHPLRIGAVVLTHNSTDDLPDCLTGLLTQTDVDLRVIVVDNASRPEARARMEADFLVALHDGRVLDVAEARPEEIAALPGVFLRNPVNGGYSAGNNIGARLAAAIGCDAVLIVNPDVRMLDPGYAAALGALIRAHPMTAVACSRICTLSGAQENPMTEPGFIEEILWPVTMLTAGLFGCRRHAQLLSAAPFRVAKVSGACFLVRTDFLRRIGYFDESVFLYCEESILGAQVVAADWHMMMDPCQYALHAHRANTKGDQLQRFRIWARSRGQFHAAYSNYGAVRRAILWASRSLMLSLIWAKSIFERTKIMARLP